MEGDEWEAMSCKLVSSESEGEMQRANTRGTGNGGRRGEIGRIKTRTTEGDRQADRAANKQVCNSSKHSSATIVYYCVSSPNMNSFFKEMNQSDLLDRISQMLHINIIQCSVLLLLEFMLMH